MTSYKSSNVAVAECDALLVEELNLFFARFEVESTVSQTPTHSSFILTVEEHEEAYYKIGESKEGCMP